jgi:hypothetical protein
MKYTVEIASDDLIYITSLTRIGLGIRILLRVLPQQFEKL